ncbi:MAG: sigma-E factor negative regulatory protein [Kangiellaceae bacterium]|nr:sigma-E factor negative regulatory protein [Kangiellaceae bacterium]
MVENKELLSDLLDERCDSVDIDNLLADEHISEEWFRYHAVSAILRDEHSAHSSLNFCNEISAKISDEPAIVAFPKPQTSRISGDLTRKSEVRRIGSGFAIAASVAIATFLSVQTTQIAQDQPSSSEFTASTPTESAKTTKDSTSYDSIALSNDLNSNEQVELELFNDAYLQDFQRNDKGNFAPVAGEFVRTVRLSAEEWQALLASSAKRQQRLEQARKLDVEKEIETSQ